MHMDNGNATINHSIRLCKIMQFKNAEQGCTYIYNVYHNDILSSGTIVYERVGKDCQKRFDFNYYILNARQRIHTHDTLGDIAVTRLSLLCSILLHNIFHAEFTVGNFPLHVHLYPPPNCSQNIIQTKYFLIQFYIICFTTFNISNNIILNQM